MRKICCDKCGKEISITDDRLEIWDKTFRDDLNGVIWRIIPQGNFMDKHVDACFPCKKYGLSLLVKEFSSGRI